MVLHKVLDVLMLKTFWVISIKLFSVYDKNKNNTNKLKVVYNTDESVYAWKFYA